MGRQKWIWSNLTQLLTVVFKVRSNGWPLAGHFRKVIVLYAFFPFLLAYVLYWIKFTCGLSNKTSTRKKHTLTQDKPIRYFYWVYLTNGRSALWSEQWYTWLGQWNPFIVSTELAYVHRIATIDTNINKDTKTGFHNKLCWAYVN